MRGNAGVVLFIIFFAAVLALSQGWLPEGSLTGSNIYFSITDKCGSPVEDAAIYNYYDTCYYDSNEGCYKLLPLRVDNPPLYAIRPSSDISSRGVYVCNKPKWLFSDGTIAWDFIEDWHKNRYSDYQQNVVAAGYQSTPQPAVFTDAECVWVSRNRLLTEGASISSPISLTLGDCAPSAVCGNGILESGEECDGSAGVTAGYECTSDCRLREVQQPPEPHPQPKVQTLLDLIFIYINQIINYIRGLIGT